MLITTTAFLLYSLRATDILIALVVFTLSYMLIAYCSKRKNLPPGPSGFPIIGCLPHIKDDPHLKLQDMAAKYGDVFSMNLGSRLVVVLNGVDAIKEGLNKMEFLGRPQQGSFNLIDNQQGIILINGKPFHEQRKFMLHSMRDLGLGKTVLEECMKEELDHFLTVLEDTKGQPYDVRTTLSPSVSNNITAMVYGERYDYEDSRRILLDSVLRTVQDFISQSALHVFFPWIIKLPFVKHFFGYHRVQTALRRLDAFTSNRIEEHKKTLDSNHARDYIDKFLLEIQRVKDKNIRDTSFTEEMMIGNTGALLGAGTESVHTTLCWCLLLMAVYQEIQRKVQEEISVVVGSERMPAYSDQKEMPYTQSVIMEIMRLKTVTPLNLLRCALEDTTFRGYHIPKDTLVLANFWSAHFDKRHWKDPEKFHPERFLSTDGKTAVKPEAFMPFSVGRRSCPGESMAVVEIFIYFSTILQRFHIRLPEGSSPDLKGDLKISYYPKPQNLRFISRRQI